MRAVPVTRDEANAFMRHHRHHGGVTGYRCAVGCTLDDQLVGVAIVGRPTARLMPQKRFAEVTRLCTTGEKNVCSFLYSRCARVARELGFDAVFTYILESETGASLTAAGWVYVYSTRGGSHDRPSRRRADKAPTCPKQLWAPPWSVGAITETIARAA